MRAMASSLKRYALAISAANRRPIRSAQYKKRIFHLLILTNSIETEFLHDADVVLDCLVGQGVRLDSGQ
jgi:hypothetical protein